MVTETLAVVGISLWGIMKNVELKQQAIAYIERLSTEKLEVVLDYLAALESSDLWAPEAESEALKSSDKAEPLLDRHDELIGDELLAELSGRVHE